jgi:hypothetical protein
VTRLVADGHVHLYPFYDLGRALTALEENLRGHGAGGVPAGFLAERHDCHVFEGLRKGRLQVPGVDLRPAGDDRCLVRAGESGPRLFLFSGRQIVTAERLEVLALTLDLPLADGLPAADVVRRVLDAGGVPVLAWAPGKWFFERGKAVAALLRRFAPGELLLGDTSLRPTLWGEPRPMREARRRGFGVLAGSDPLPVAGEEGMPGRYATILDGDIEVARPLAGVRQALRSAGGLGPHVGARGGVVETLRRLRGNAAARKSTAA